MKHNTFKLFVLLVLLAGFTIPALAQSPASSAILSINTSQFPMVNLVMNIRDDAGEFIPDLSTHDVSVLEDGIQISPDSVELISPGVQVVVAINPGVAFSIPNQEGLSRFQLIVNHLQDWANSTPSAQDDMSLITPNFILSQHEEQPQNWLTELLAYSPDYTTGQPSLTVLNDALDLVSDPLPREGMGKAILFITANTDEQNLESLQGLIDRANAVDVRIFVWIVDSAANVNLDSTIQIESLATSTGGDYFYFSGGETFPEISSYLDPIRNVYQINYRSKLSTSGVHQVQVITKWGDNQINSSPSNFDIQILPPNPIFVDPVSEIYFVPVTEETADLIEASQNVYSYEILVEFPDEFPRDLKRTSLYIDGEIAITNTSAPFDVFLLNLNSFSESKIVYIKAEAEDELGMIGTSIEIPVQIIVESPPTYIETFFSGNGPFLALAITGLSGGALLLILVLSGKLTPKPPISPDSIRRLNDPVTVPLKNINAAVTDTTVQRSKLSGPHQRKEDILTRPVEILPPKKVKEPAIRRLGTYGPLKNLGLSQKEKKPEYKPNVFLIPYPPEEGDDSDYLPLDSQEEILIGSNEAVVGILLNSPSIEPIHARIWQDKWGNFHIADNGTTARTWVNFDVVPVSGVEIENGDILHFGIVGFRFIQAGLSKIKPIIRKEGE
ncbi:MAG: FHA domain-containing protein [Anaerolineales bacterium]|nr:FHA domain-containing protein [Anaerolineales bacterium]